MSVIPKKRLCFGDIAMLRFHKARTTDGNPSSHATQWMVDSYPGDIRSWIEIMGGVEKMPAETYWTMPAPTLWKLGYRRCN